MYYKHLEPRWDPHHTWLSKPYNISIPDYLWTCHMFRVPFGGFKPTTGGGSGSQLNATLAKKSANVRDKAHLKRTLSTIAPWTKVRARMEKVCLRVMGCCMQKKATVTVVGRIEASYQCFCLQLPAKFGVLTLARTCFLCLNLTFECQCVLRRRIHFDTKWTTWSLGWTKMALSFGPNRGSAIISPWFWGWSCDLEDIIYKSMKDVQAQPFLLSKCILQTKLLVTFLCENFFFLSQLFELFQFFVPGSWSQNGCSRRRSRNSPDTERICTSEFV